MELSLSRRAFLALAALCGVPCLATAQTTPPDTLFKIEKTESSFYSPGATTSVFTTTYEGGVGPSAATLLDVNLLGLRDTRFVSLETAYRLRAYFRGNPGGTINYRWTRSVDDSGQPEPSSTSVYKPSNAQVFLKTGLSFLEPMTVPGLNYTDNIVVGPPAWGIASRWFPEQSGGGGTDALLLIADSYTKTGATGTVPTYFPEYPGVPYYQVLNERVTGRVARSNDTNINQFPGGSARLLAHVRFTVERLP